MDQRAIETLAWLDERDSDVAAHPGMAFTEREILRMLVDGTTPGADDVVTRAHRMEFERRLFPTTNRAEARAFAHIAMFASSFGQVAINAPAGAGEAIDAAISANMDDTDTLGELLIAAKIVGHTSSIVTSGRIVFDADWSVIPRDDFSQNYHAVLVGGLLYAME